MTVYIYGLFDPRDSSLRYIGKSVHPEQRLREHVYEAIRETGNTSPKVGWIKRLISLGLIPALEILEECNQKSWELVEQSWIEDARKFGLRLLNLTSGGDNPPTWDEMVNPEQAKLKVASSNRTRRPPNLGRKWSKEYKQKMSRSLSGKNNPMFGKFGKDHPAFGRVVSEETCARLSESLRGQKNPMFGKTHSEEAKAKLSQSSKGRSQSDITKKKRSLACLMHHAEKRGNLVLVKELNQEYFTLFGIFHPRFGMPDD